MKIVRKTKFVLEAAVVFAIAFTLLLPTTMANTNEEQTTSTSLDIIWEDNFDSYDLYQFLDGDPEDGGWKGWDDDPAWGSYVVDDQALSSPHSIEIAQDSDTVQQYTGLVSGTYVYTAMQYVPNDFVGQSYFILLSHYEVPATQESCLWAVQIRFDSAGIVESEHGGPSTTLITGQWVELRTEIDLDADSYSFYYDGELLETKAWTATPNNDFTGVLEISAVDLFAYGATPVYYDDMVLEGVIVELPELEVSITPGIGIGVGANIANTGDAPATDVEWTISVTGGILKLIDKQFTGTVSSIDVDADEDIKSGLIFGLGKIAITVSAECAEGVDDEATGEGTQIIIFTSVS